MAVISESAKTEISRLYHEMLGWSPIKGLGERVLLSYTGDISQPKIDLLLRLSENAILDNGSKRMVMKRVCSVIIECLQNTAIHGTKDGEGNLSNFYVLRANADSFIITTGNLILKHDAHLLGDKIDHLGSMSLPELRKMYIETLCNDSFNDKGGAGLGFLTMAKRSNYPMQYSITEVNDRFSFFTVSVSVSR